MYNFVMLYKQRTKARDVSQNFIVFAKLAYHSKKGEGGGEGLVVPP